MGLPERLPEPADEVLRWHPQAPRWRISHLLVAWLVGGISVFVAAALVPGVHVASFRDALVAALVIAALNAVLPPIVAALRLPYTAALGFVLVLALDAAMLVLASNLDSQAIEVDSFGWALLAAVVIAAALIVLDVVLGVNDDDTFTFRVVRRIARRQGGSVHSDEPGIVFLEIDGLALPVLQRAMRDGSTPVLTSWLQGGTHGLLEWETDLSSQTGASQAGILLGSNEGIPAFRWVEKETGRMMTCSSPDDCAEIERRLADGRGLLAGDGASRGNLFSGEAEAMILTVSHIAAEKRSNPGYRAFLANGFNAVRMLVRCLPGRAANRARKRRASAPPATTAPGRAGRYPCGARTPLAWLIRRT